MDKSSGSFRSGGWDGQEIRAVQARIQERVGPQKYNAWFLHGTRLAMDETHVTVSVPNPFVANWIEMHFQTDIAQAAADESGKPRRVVVTVDPSLTGDIRRHQLDSQADIVAKAQQGRSRRTIPVSSLRYRLDDFVVGDSNRMAFEAARTIAARKPSFDTLFVHGPCGVGKTHLLQGVCDAFRKLAHDGRPLRWRYVSAEQFTNEFVQSIHRKKSDEFRARYRHVDLLAIDDVHFLAAKKATQEEFLHTFNAIKEAGRRVVLASDAAPRLVGQLHEQLVSRFIAGMVVKIDPPDRQTRMEILRRKAAGMGLTVGPDVLEYLAAHIRGSVRELEGGLLRVGALAALTAGEVTLAMATEALADHLARTDSATTAGDIEAAVAAFFGITPADIHSSRRTRTVSAARTVAMYLTRRHTLMSFPEIGRYMGKNHSSAILAVKRMEKLLAVDGEIAWHGPAGTRTMRASRLIETLSEQFA